MQEKQERKLFLAKLDAFLGKGREKSKDAAPSVIEEHHALPTDSVPSLFTCFLH